MSDVGSCIHITPEYPHNSSVDADRRGRRPFRHAVALVAHQHVQN